MASAMALFWFCLAIQSAFAQAATGIGAALKGIKPVAPCGRNKPAKPKPVNPAPVPEVNPDLSCAIDPNGLARYLKSPGALVVDTRGSLDFSEYHIDGAINLGAAELRGKPFLHDKAIVLVGNGKAERELYRDCKRLKAAGFKQTRVLRGGLPTWLASGHNVTGQAPDLGQAITLTPAELWVEGQFKANRVVVAPGLKALQKHLPSSSLVSATSPEAIQATVIRDIKHVTTGKLASVILLAGAGFDPTVLSKAISPIPLLVYSGTAGDYSNQLAQQAAVWAAHARGPKQPSGCRR